MQDTLKHLVKDTIHRTDSNKFLYILNQIDTAAREDNPEEVFSAWQRALAQHGMTAGRYYTIYDEGAAIPIEDERIRSRFEIKRDKDLRDIYSRMEQVSVERAYRIVGMLEQAARTLKQDLVPFLNGFIRAWRRKVLMIEGGIVGFLVFSFFALTIWRGYWKGLHLEVPFLDPVISSSYLREILVVLFVFLALWGHHVIRRRSGLRLMDRFLQGVADQGQRDNYRRALEKNFRWYRSIFCTNPAGWGNRANKRVEAIIDDSNRFMQRLNDLYTDPSGESKRVPATEQSTFSRNGEPQHPFPDFGPE